MRYKKINNLKPGMAKDQLRPALTGAYFDGDFLTVTTGHILGKIRVERTEAEKEIAAAAGGIIIPLDAIDMYQKGKTKRFDFDEVKLTRKNVQVKKPGHTIIFKTIPEPYPDVDKVLKPAQPSDRANKKKRYHTVAFNAGLLKDLADVLGCESITVTMDIDDTTAPIYVKPRIRKDYDPADPDDEGILMPIRMDRDK